jgi:hypothetical protein
MVIMKENYFALLHLSRKAQKCRKKQRSVRTPSSTTSQDGPRLRTVTKCPTCPHFGSSTPGDSPAHYFKCLLTALVI